MRQMIEVVKSIKISDKKSPQFKLNCGDFFKNKENQLQKRLVLLAEKEGFEPSRRSPALRP